MWLTLIEAGIRAFTAYCEMSAQKAKIELKVIVKREVEREREIQERIQDRIIVLRSNNDSASNELADRLRDKLYESTAYVSTLPAEILVPISEPIHTNERGNLPAAD